MSSANQPPDPFSREGSSSDDQDSSASSNGESPWPRYQYGPASNAPAPGYDQPQGSPYETGADTVYGSSSQYPGMPAYDADQPYGSNYGDSPYAVNPYQSSFGSATPYQPEYGGPNSYGVPAVQHPQAIIAMVLGILGLAVCPLIGIAALILGNKARKEIDASPGRFSGRGMATAGFVLGIISIVVTVLLILLIVLGVAGALSS